MLEVGHTARRHKIPGPLAHTMIDVAQSRSSSGAGMSRPQYVLPQGCLLARPTPCCFATQLYSFLSLWLPHVGGLSGCWNTSQISMEVDRKQSARLADIYYSPREYWKGLAANKNLSATQLQPDGVLRR